MTVLYEVTLDRKSARFATLLRETRAHAEALKKQHPELQLVVGHREVASKLHIVIAAASPPIRRRPVAAAAIVTTGPAGTAGAAGATGRATAVGRVSIAAPSQNWVEHA